MRSSWLIPIAAIGTGTNLYIIYQMHIDADDIRNKIIETEMEVGT